MPDLLDDDFKTPKQEPPKLQKQQQEHLVQQWLTGTIVCSILIGFGSFFLLFPDFQTSRKILSTNIILFGPLLRIIFMVMLFANGFFSPLEKRNRAAIFHTMTVPNVNRRALTEAIAEFIVWLFAFPLVVIISSIALVLLTSLLGVNQIFPLQHTSIVLGVVFTISCYAYYAYQLALRYLEKQQ